MNEIISALVLTIFSFGAAIFYVLSCIERSVLPLGTNPESPIVADQDVRFVYSALQRLVPLLPPSNGAVIVLGSGALVYQAAMSGWQFLSLVAPLFYWLVMIYIIFVTDIAGAVRALREGSHTDSQSVLRRKVGRLVVQHHIALSANAGVVFLQFAWIIAT